MLFANVTYLLDVLKYCGETRLNIVIHHRSLNLLNDSWQLKEAQNIDIHLIKYLSIFCNISSKFFYFRFQGRFWCDRLYYCTHIALIRPDKNEHLYYNRKGYHSLNVQMVRLYELPLFIKFYTYLVFTNIKTVGSLIDC